jgi:hypothetical protein
MESPSKLETGLKIFTPLLTLVTVIVGVYQFNLGQEQTKNRELNMRQMEIDKMNNQLNREILSKFKDNQNKIYSETLSVIGYLATHKEYTTEKYKENLTRFNQLFYVDLSSVATDDVNKQLLIFQNGLKNLAMNNYRGIDVEMDKLQDAAENVALAIRESSMDYSLPGGLKGLDSSGKK